MPGGYLLTAEYLQEGKTDPVVSRRYIKVGSEDTDFKYCEINP